MIHRFATFEIDEDKRELRAAGRVIEVQPRVFDLLAFLARNRQRVVSKDELLDSVWPEVTVADGSLQHAVSLARRALALAGAEPAIRTFSGRGYRLCDDLPDDTAKPAGSGATAMAPAPREAGAEEQRLIRAHLDAIARHELFKGSKRMTAMLRHMVAEELAGRGENMTPDTVSQALGGGEPSTPAMAGFAVRVEAGELRARLHTYYATAGVDDAVRIELPGGRFSPRIFIRGMALDGRDTASRQEIHFLRGHDGTSLAYAISGLGHPLVKAANWLSHLEYDHESPVWRHWWRELSERFQLIRYDQRGCGLSAWEVAEFSFESWVRDLEAVVDTAGVGRFALLGISQGAAVAIAYALRHPERVSHLVLYGGYAEGRLKRARTDEERKEVAMLQDLTRLGWGRGNPAFQKVFASLFLPGGTAEQQRGFVDLQRVSCSPENAVRFRAEFARIDVANLAPRVTAPTLVLHVDRDHVVPIAQARLLATLIPHARFVQLEGENHILREDEPAWPRFLDEVSRFVR